MPHSNPTPLPVHASPANPTAFATDVATEIARSMPLISDRSARGFAEGIVGGNLRETFPSPHPTRTWHDSVFHSADQPVRDTLAVRVGAMAPYANSAHTSRDGGLERTKLTPVALKFHPSALSLPARLVARIVVSQLTHSIANTTVHVYTSSATLPSFDEVRTRVRAEQSKPKGRILKALQAPLAQNQEIFERHGAEVAIVAVPGLHHPTYIAATLQGGVIEGHASPTALALCKLNADPDATELTHLDAFAGRMLGVDRSIDHQRHT